MGRRLLFNVVVAACLAAIVVTVVVVLDQVLTGAVNWAAIEALGSLTAAVAAVLAVAALGFAADDLARKAETERVSRMPYLRVDLGFDGLTGQGFHPPSTKHVFDAADFNMADDANLFAAIVPPSPADDGLSLVVWLTNLQSASLGTAYDITVQVVIAWNSATQGEGTLAGSPTQSATTTVAFTYIAPQQTTAFRLVTVRSDISWLFAEVTAVTYGDLFASERLIEAHGALTMLYDRERGVRNERGFQLSRK